LPLLSFGAPIGFFGGIITIKVSIVSATSKVADRWNRIDCEEERVQERKDL